jgi:cobalamin biosynthesis protein CobD/CbiB
MQQWLSEHWLVSYLLILACTMYIFNKVFRTTQKRMPILKEILVHLVMVIGCLVLLVLQIDKLPILQCMAVAVFMMMLLRGRQLYDKLKNRGQAGTDDNNAVRSDSSNP